MRRILVLARPFGIALGIFIFLNLFLALRSPHLSANSIWLYLRIREPLLSAIAVILGCVLLVPHGLLARPWVRFVSAGVLLAFLVLVSANILGFYAALLVGRIEAALPVPFSAGIAAILGLEAARAVWWAPSRPTLPLPARRFLEGVMIAGAFFVLILAHIVSFGMTDYAPAATDADAIVVLGARVSRDREHPLGRLSPALEDRVETGIRLYAEGKGKWMIFTGGVEPDGLSEPRAMAAYAIARGIPAEAIIPDEAGMNTFLSAQNCAGIARERGFRKLLIVSQYYHNARVKLIFEREFAPCFTVPARYRRLAREGFFLFRETIAFIDYLLRVPRRKTGNAGDPQDMD